MIYLLDTGPLVSALARKEPQFGPWAKDLMRLLPRPLHTCEAVPTEAAHFLGGGDPVVATLSDRVLACPWDLPEHHARVRELVLKYADHPKTSP